MDGIDLPDLTDGRLRLRPPEERDVARVTAICQDVEVQRWTRVPVPYTEDDARRFVQFSSDGLSHGTGVRLVAVAAGADGVLGPDAAPDGDADADADVPPDAGEDAAPDGDEGAVSDVVLGAAGIDIHRRDLSGELGYWVAPDARRRGIATRSSRLLLRFAFGPLQLGYVGLWAAADNPGSNAVARSLGFTFEGTARDAFLLGLPGEPDRVRGDANRWGLRPEELT